MNRIVVEQSQVWRRWTTRLSVIPVLAACLALSGCHYTTNRAADLGDVFVAGAGITTEGVGNMIAPPSLAAYVQVTDYVNLGFSRFYGLVAEIDGRSTYAGPEGRDRRGLLLYQGAQIYQEYKDGNHTYAKRDRSLWSERMQQSTMTIQDTPAKLLNYSYMSASLQEGYPLFPRGWQYWGTVMAEVGISEPFLTHLGLHLRLGIDFSEISDFIIGFTTIDFKRDDYTLEEFDELRGARGFDDMDVDMGGANL